MSSYWSNWRSIRSEMISLEDDYERGQRIQADHVTNEELDEVSEDADQVMVSDRGASVEDLSDEINYEGSQNDELASESSDSLYEQAVEADLAVELATWATNHKITRSATNDLLVILRNQGHDYLPKDQRTLQKIPSEIESFDKCGGKYIYFGIDNGIQQIINENAHQIPDLIEVSFNIDGLPLFKSSPMQFWPILGMVKSEVFTVLLWYGGKKPNSLSDYLEDFTNELKLLDENNGIIYKGITIPVKVDFYICDTPARSLLKGTIAHTGYHSCERCTAKGLWLNHRIVFFENDSDIRTDEKFANFEYEGTHQNMKSPLIDVNVNCITQFPLDYMHLVCLGIVRRILNFLKSGPRLCKLSQHQISEISDHLSSLKGCLPSEFVRQPRSMFELDRWKATELRSFLLYTGPVVLKSVLEHDIYNHFMCLSVAVSIMLTSNNDTRNNLKEYAKALTRYFVSHAPDFYGETFNVYNVHSLIHITDDLTESKSLNDMNAFPFENYLQKMKKMVRNGNNPVAQVAKRLGVLKRYGSAVTKKNFSKVSVQPPNNCFYIPNNKIIILKVDNGDGYYHCHEYDLNRMENFFHEPENSKKFQIAFFTKNLKSTQVQVHQSMFLKKAILLPYRNGFVVYPLLHEIEK